MSNIGVKNIKTGETQIVSEETAAKLKKLEGGKYARRFEFSNVLDKPIELKDKKVSMPELAKA